MLECENCDHLQMTFDVVEYHVKLLLVLDSKPDSRCVGLLPSFSMGYITIYTVLEWGYGSPPKYVYFPLNLIKTEDFVIFRVL